MPMYRVVRDGLGLTAGALIHYDEQVEEARVMIRVPTLTPAVLAALHGDGAIVQVDAKRKLSAPHLSVL